MTQKHSQSSVLPENEERMKRLIKLTARLVDKMLSTTSLPDAQTRSKPNEH